jgi:hypothetical protein
MRVVTCRAVTVTDEDHAAGNSSMNADFFSGHDRWRISDHLTGVDDLTGNIRRKGVVVCVVHGDQ